MSSNFRQIKLLTTELAALEHLKYQCLHFFSVGIDPILFKVGGYICIISCMSLSFGQMGPLTVELVALEHLKKLMSPRFLWHIQTADIVELIGPEKTIALLLENYSKYFNDFT